MAVGTTEYGEKWAICGFRTEGTGYPDSHVYGTIVTENSAIPF
jgi:hypothetical protein